jgi:hypothetical protein
MNPLTPLTALASTNVAHSTPATILSAPPIMQTPTTSGSVLTSNVARDNVNAANSYLTNVNTAAANNRTVAQTTPTTTTPTTTGKTTSDIYNTVSSIGADLSDAKLSKKAKKGMTSQEAAQALYKKQVRKITQQLTGLQSNMDARTSETIAGIGREYDALVQDQEAANYQYESGVTTAGFRSGLNQYASQIQGNILHNAMSEGIKKISNIQIARAKLINEAEAARDERNYKLLTAKMDALRQNYKDEQDATYRMQDEVRKVKEDERKDYEYKGTMVAPAILSELQNNPNLTLEEVLSQASQNSGVPASVLGKYVAEYQTEQNKQYDTADVKEFNFAVSRGEIPKNSSFSSWLRSKASSSVSGKVSETASQAWNLYGDVGQEAIGAGLSPSQAVIEMVREAELNGTKISLATQNELLQYVNELKGQDVQKLGEDQVAPLPGETPDTASEFFLGLFSPDIDELKAKRIRDAELARIKEEMTN